MHEMKTPTRHDVRRRQRTTPKLALPHERDESTELSKRRDATIRQAARDVDAGLIDTDNYTRIAEITGAPRHKRRLRP